MYDPQARQADIRRQGADFAREHMPTHPIDTQEQLPDPARLRIISGRQVHQVDGVNLWPDR